MTKLDPQYKRWSIQRVSHGNEGKAARSSAPIEKQEDQWQADEERLEDGCRSAQILHHESRTDAWRHIRDPAEPTKTRSDRAPLRADASRARSCEAYRGRQRQQDDWASARHQREDGRDAP